jgi:heptosyltransferase III
MSFKVKINKIRSSIMRGLTGNIGKSAAVKYSKKNKPELKRILISRPNDRLGNLLLVTPLLQEITAICPDCKIDLFVRGNLAPIIFKNYPNIDRIIRLPKKPFKELPRYISKWFLLKSKKYDLVINVVKNSSSGRLSTLAASSKIKFFGDDFNEAVCPHIARCPVFNLRKFLAILGYTTPEVDAPLLDIKLSEDEKAEGKKSLDAVVPSTEKQTICLFTNATGDKKLSVEWWETFFAKLQENFPGYNIVEALPIENTSQIDFKAPSYYTKDIRELGAFISNCRLFIGADSGVMHLASAAQTTTIGLFRAANAEMYTPYGNSSTHINVCDNSVDEVIAAVKNIVG